MPKDQKTPNQTIHNGLVRLLRLLGRRSGILRDSGIYVEVVIDESSEARRIERPVLEEGLSAGLLRVDNGRLTAQETAAAFLRRAMVKERDEIFQEQHRRCDVAAVEIKGVRQTVRRNDLSSPLLALGRLKDRGGESFFPAEAVDAGERLARDFHRGQLSPRVTASWEPRVASRVKGHNNAAQDLSDSAMAARLRFSKAAEAMGPELSGVAIDVCCFEKGLELVERERQWPVRSAKLMLRTALLALARHYSPPPPANAHRRQSHHWGAQDYRPLP